MPRFHHQRFSDEHYGETVPVFAVLEKMDPKNIPFIALIVGPTISGKAQYRVRQLRGQFRGLAVSALHVYYQREAIMVTLQRTPAPSEPEPEPEPKPKRNGLNFFYVINEQP